MRKKIIIPKRSGNQNISTSIQSTVSTVCSESKTIIKDGVAISTDPKTRGIEGLKHFTIGAILAVVSFIFFYWVSHFFDIHWILRSIVALVFSYLAIRAWDKATGEIPTLKSGAVANFTVIAFVISLLIGYQNSSNLVVDEMPIETLTLLTAESFPMTSKCYHAGEQVKVNIIGSPVKIVMGEELAIGEHIIDVTSDGRLCFHIEKNTPAKVEVY